MGNTPSPFLEQWKPAQAQAIPCEPVLSGACCPTGALPIPLPGEKKLKEHVAIIWSTGLFSLPTLISSTGRDLDAGPVSPPQPHLTPRGHSRKASILALVGMAGSPISTWVAGTAVQGHFTVSALEEKSAMRTPRRAKGVGVSKETALGSSASLPLGCLFLPSFIDSSARPSAQRLSHW